MPLKYSSPRLLPHRVQVLLRKHSYGKKLSFAAKWNIRDISRNRIRTLVGFFGVALSAALVFTAFGANELLGSVGDWQYSELNTANYMVMFSYDTAPDVVYDYARQFDGQMVMSLSTELFSADFTGKLNSVRSGIYCEYFV